MPSMKSAIIFVLLLALLGAAALTRPGEDDFKRFIVAKSTQNDSNILKAGWDQFQADEFVKKCTFNNRILWTSVQQDGKTIYTGAFSHWFNRDEVAKRVKTVKQDVGAIKDKVGSVKMESTK
jgi:hypothetical protein